MRKLILIILAPLLVLFILFLLSLAACGCKCTEGSSCYPECICKENPDDPKCKGGASVEQKEIVFWNLFDDQSAFRGQIEEFESLPEIKAAGIHIRYKKFSSEKEYEKLLLNEMAEGGGPDIFTLHYSQILQNTQKFTPAPTSLINGEIFREKFSDVTSKILIHKNDSEEEEVLGIPLFVDTLGLYYNNKYFKEVFPTNPKPQETWGGIKEQAAQMTKTNGNRLERFDLSGIAMGRSDNIFRAVDILNLLFVQYGTPMVDEEKEKTGISASKGEKTNTEKAYDEPGEQAMLLFTGFANTQNKHYSWNNLITARQADAKEFGVFAHGLVGMIFGYATDYERIVALAEEYKKNKDSDAVDKKDIFTIEAPQLIPKGETKTGAGDALANFYPLLVSRNSAYPEYAWEFLLFLSEENRAREYAKNTQKPSAILSVNKEQWSDPLIGPFARQVPYSKTIPMVDKSSYHEMIEEGIKTTNKNSKSIKDVLNTMEKQFQCLLDKSLKKDSALDTECLLEK
ncbi:extracellular solute-binding protein [Candidatus Peregrinibacteria bacterium]|nr:MAG: extracellular solute-binding protein [Candidatus Peregrinibacteria bacterium]